VTQAGILTTAINIFTSPGEAFAVIRERRSFLVPLVLIGIGVATINYLYLSEVDIGWMTEQQLRNQTIVDLTDLQIETMANQAADRGRGRIIVQGMIGAMFGVPIFFLLQALYLKIVTLIRKDHIPFRQWFSLISWASLPSILASIASIVYLLTNDVRFVGQTSLNPLSFGNLLGLELEGSSTFATAAAGMGPINVWSMILVILGYRAFTDSGTIRAASIILAPVLVIGALLYIVS